MRFVWSAKFLFCAHSIVARVNAELNKQVRDLQAEAVDLRAENARLCSAHQSTQARLENTLKQLEHHQKSDRLMKALQLISSTADQALLDFQDQESERPHSSNSSFNFDADTILPSASNSLKASRQDSRPPLISTKPDLSLIDEASHEESFYRQSVQQQQQQYQQQQRFEDGPPLLPPSVVFTRPRRSSSAASLRPMLDE